MRRRVALQDEQAENAKGGADANRLQCDPCAHHAHSVGAVHPAARCRAEEELEAKRGQPKDGWGHEVATIGRKLEQEQLAAAAHTCTRRASRAWGWEVRAARAAGCARAQAHGCQHFRSVDVPVLRTPMPSIRASCTRETRGAARRRRPYIFRNTRDCSSCVSHEWDGAPTSWPRLRPSRASPPLGRAGLPPDEICRLAAQPETCCSWIAQPRQSALQ